MGVQKELHDLNTEIENEASDSKNVLCDGVRVNNLKHLHNNIFELTNMCEGLERNLYGSASCLEGHNFRRQRDEHSAVCCSQATVELRNPD